MKTSMRNMIHKERKIGTILQIPSEEVAEMLGHAGLEFIVLDMEHCPMSHRKIVSMIRACEAADTIPFVRVPDVTDEDSIKKALDAGASGILVPNVETAEQAELAVHYGKYAPMGKRGACPYVRANWFGGEDCGAYFEKANQETMIMLLVEGPEGVKNLPEIMRVEGVDVIQIGTVDLAVALGIPGQTNHPSVRRVLRQAAELAAENGKQLSYYCGTPEEVKEVRDWPGIGLYLCPIPETILHGTYQKMVTQMQEWG